MKKAVEEKTYRSKLVQEKIQEMITEGVILIDTEDQKVGRLTACRHGSRRLRLRQSVACDSKLRLGREGVIDIEREAKMVGRFIPRAFLS